MPQARSGANDLALIKSKSPETLHDGVFLRPVAADELFVSDELGRTLPRLLHFCRSEQALVALTGAPGTGKSTVLRWLHQQLPQDTHDILLVAMVQRETQTGWLTPRVAELLGIKASEPGPAALPQTMRIVASRLDELIDEQRKLLVAIDAAHLAATPDALAEIAAFLNLQSLSGSCLSFLLVGDPTLLTVAGQCPDLSTKLTANLSLPKLTPTETIAYVAHRLQQAPAVNIKFNHDALAFLHDYTTGVIGTINALAENCLIDARQRGSREVTLDIARAAAKHVGIPASLATADQPPRSSVSNSNNPASSPSPQAGSIKLTSLFKREP